MKKLLTLSLTLVMAVCLVNLNNSHTKAEDENPIDYTTQPLCITAGSSGATIHFWSDFNTKPTLKYRIGDSVGTYTDCTFTGNDTQVIILNANEKVYFKGTNSKMSAGAMNNTTRLKIDSGTISVSGNIMSLLDETNFASMDTIAESGCFSCLFLGCADLTSIDNLKLPAKTLSNGCYAYMFQGCTSLTNLPIDLLPATTLTQLCYNNMFNGCNQLTNIPNLPATTLATTCYNAMFSGCTDLYKGLSESPTAELTEKFTIPTNGLTATWVSGCTNSMFTNTGGTLTASPDFSTQMTYYRKPTSKPEPQPEPKPADPKDESCEKVIGPTWHWNNDKGICEEYATVGTSTR